MTMTSRTQGDNKKCKGTHTHQFSTTHVYRISQVGLPSFHQKFECTVRFGRIGWEPDTSRTFLVLLSWQALVRCKNPSTEVLKMLPYYLWVFSFFFFYMSVLHLVLMKSEVSIHISKII